MRQDLVGYLFDSLDEKERAEIDLARQNQDTSSEIEKELEAIQRAIEPLKYDDGFIDPPVGLAARTITAVKQSSVSKGPVLSPASDLGSIIQPRIWLDRMILAAASIAAIVLLAPLLFEAMEDARATRAQQNLQKVAAALQGYADTHGMYPTPPDAGPLSRAGLYAPTLVSEHRIRPDDGLLVYPGSALNEKNFQVPSREEIEAAVGTEGFEKLIGLMGGDYGYTLGYRDESGHLKPIRNQQRSHHPIMADAPDASGEQSSNHPDGAHHIVYEDGRVERIWVTNSTLDQLHKNDHLYLNNDGKIAAGKDMEDAVIGDSHHQP
ncbi:MAG: hypothetical protein HOD99_00300 [Planctomycetaceae bacterium]|nr:hypothetical protein [Planctomycetaceae bacterium]